MNQNQSDYNRSLFCTYLLSHEKWTQKGLMDCSPYKSKYNLIRITISANNIQSTLSSIYNLSKYTGICFSNNQQANRK